MSIGILSPAARIAHKTMDLFNSVFGRVTIGVRAILIDDSGRIALVRHSYMPGLYLPGGKVKRKESSVDCLRRELKEELDFSIDTTDVIEIQGVFFSTQQGRRDHIILYSVHTQRARMDMIRARDSIEIEGIHLTTCDPIPEDASPATKRRIDSYRQGQREIGEW
jgi:ADP-ribose pyrophosphatase YjhB (NUDIX family)